MADPGMHKKILGSGNTTLIISNDEIKDIKKKKGVTETVQNKVKEQKGGFLVCH